MKQGVIDFFSNDLDEIPSRLRFLFGLQKKIEPAPADSEDSLSEESKSPLSEYYNNQEILKNRWKKALLVIVPLSILLSALIVGGSIFLGLAVPEVIAGLGFALIVGAAAATPMGWAMLGLIVLVGAACTVRAVVRGLMDWANKNDVGGRLEGKYSQYDSRKIVQEISLKETFGIVLGPATAPAESADLRISTVSKCHVESREPPLDSKAMQTANQDKASVTLEVPAKDKQDLEETAVVKNEDNHTLSP